MLSYKVKTCRESLDMDQKRLSVLSGVPAPTISRIENGKVTQPRPKTLRSLALPLGVSVDFLVDPTDDMPVNRETPLDDETSGIVDLYRRLTPQQREEFRQFGRFLESQQVRRRPEEPDYELESDDDLFRTPRPSDPPER